MTPFLRCFGQKTLNLLTFWVGSSKRGSQMTPPDPSWGVKYDPFLRVYGQNQGKTLTFWEGSSKRGSQNDPLGGSQGVIFGPPISVICHSLGAALLDPVYTAQKGVIFGPPRWHLGPSQGSRSDQILDPPDPGLSGPCSFDAPLLRIFGLSTQICSKPGFGGLPE